VRKILSILIFFISGLAASTGAAADPVPDWKYVEARLKKSGFQKKFIQSLKDTYEPASFHQVLELNVLLYLRKSDDHGVQLSQRAVDTVESFMKANRPSLLAAEKEHGVSSSVIASLLWLESRHGENQGRFHVPSVYVHLLQAPRPAVIAHLHKNAKKFTPKVSKKNLADITTRTKKKADWALAELKALQTVHGKDAKRVRELRGSFAGAFGIPQFLPSSYLRWARSHGKGATPDLTKPQDAILSVAYYLRDNGWKRGKEKTFKKALLRYNNSHDYANAILKLAGQVDGRPEKRTPAATKRKKN